ncbi:polysaccharide export protein Wza [Hartmannibacter diazotrophicus]|uniref:Polysaccharide export protein Wza n=1 Tax=Hartmannibacter diazotrophicus TaxID=1482074 RepID=A0A2C9D6G8_9HYPH|nr:polysaccharide biosynthesis/export family protein [Hartmannibacter diazotrophicus]SON55115.1 polysaccharide export protein Wza [Hartmannibacter diazotrophicus]
MRYRASFLILVMLAGGCAASHPKMQPDPAAVLPYRLDSGDRLRVIVYGQEDLTNSFTVDQSGYIMMPLVGSVPARGKTTQELQAGIATSLRNGYLRDPDVSVEVEQYRPFFIMGEVRAPGQFTYVNDMTVETAIAIAGGYTARAQTDEVEITRSINGKVYRGHLAMTQKVRPGDTIRVLQRLF